MPKKLLVALVLTAAGLPAMAAPAGSPWGADYFPNVELTNQDGKKVRFYDDLLKGKVVEINFIYATCPGPCPLETANLRQVQEQLGDRVGREIFMYSITLDPKTDTPAVLKAYAEKFKVGPGWQFLTGREEDITLLRKKLGLFTEGPFTEHGASLVVGNEATGQWIKRSALDSPKVLARVLGDTLFNHRTPTAPGASYASAPRTAGLEDGEGLFRRRCQSCHTIGAGDTLGPDLLGVVQRRDADWLSRWLREPDRMLAEKDPVAIELFERFKQLPMPNLGLSQSDVEALMSFMEAESRRITAPGTAAPSPR